MAPGTSAPRPPAGGSQRPDRRRRAAGRSAAPEPSLRRALASAGLPAVVAVPFALAAAALALATVQLWGTGTSPIPLGVDLPVDGSVGLGLVGAAATGGDDDRVQELIDGVRDLADGNTDVSFDVDADGDLGRLAAELDDLADSLAERDRRHEEYVAYTDDVIDAIDDTFYVLDREERYQRWNDTFAEVTGYDDEEIEEMHPAEFFTDEDRERVADAVDEAFETGHTRVEAAFTTAEGEEIPHEFVASRLESPDGTPVVTGIGRDVSERKRYEERLAAVSESVRRLEGAGTEEEIAETVCSIVNEELAESLCMLWFYDEEKETLVPAASTDDAAVIVEEDLGGEPPVLPADGMEMEVFRSGESVVIEDYQAIEGATYPDAPIRTVLKVPVGDTGLLAICYPEVTDVDSTTRELAEILGQHAAASLERVEREQRLARYKEFTDDVMDSIDEVFYVVDEELSFQRWNDRLEQVTGYDADEIAGMQPLEFVAEEDRDAIADALDDIFETGSARTEARVLTKDGETIPYEFTGATLEDPDGKRVLVGVGRDISERVEYERELEAIVENTEDPIYIKDREGRYVFANQAAADYLGVDTDEVVGLTDEELFDEPSTAASEDDRQVIESGEAITREVVHELDGEEVVFLDYKYPYRDERGEVVGVMGISRDITERVERERELEARTAAMEQSIDGIAILDEGERYVYANQAHADVYGYDDPEAFVGEHWRICYSDEEYQRIESEVLFELAEEGSWRGEAVGQRADGSTFPQELSLTMLDDGRVICLVRDVSERKEREAELHRSERQFEAVFEDPQMLVGLLDPDGTLLQINETAFHYVDSDRAAVVGEPFPSTPWWADTPAERVEEWIERAADGEYVEYEAELDDVTGRRSWVNGTFRPVTDESGDVVSIVVSAHDVTERVDREQELERTADLLSHAGDLADVGGWTAEISGEPPYDTEWTDNLYEIVGRSPDEPPPSGPDVVELYHPEDRDRHRAAVERALESGEEWDQELRLNTDDGEERWVRNIGRPVAEDGETVELRGVMQDITERKERERELKETRDRLAEHNRTLRQLYEVSADREMSFDEKIQQVLELGRERLGTAAAFLSSIDEENDEFEFVHTAGTIESIAPGVIAPYSETYCRKVVGKSELFDVIDAPNEGWLEDPAYERWGLDTYVGATVFVEGELAGTLSFVDEAPRDESLTEDQRTFVELATGWVSYELERRQRERDLAEYKEFTDAILDALDDVFYTLDAEGNLQRWNESLSVVTGYADAEIAEMHATDFFADEHVDRIETAIEDVFETGDAVVEAPFRTKSGESVPHEFYATLLEDPDGAPVVAGIGRDITRRRERERELEETNARLGAVVEASPAALVAIDDDADVQLWNPAAEEIFGWTEEEVVGDELPFVPERKQAEFREFRERLFDGESITNYETVREAKDGSEVHVSLSVAPLRNDDGDVVGVMGAIQDVSERKQYERELERTTELLEQAQYVADVGGWELDLRSDPPEMTWTSELYDIHGVDPDTDVDLETTLACYHPDDRERIEQTVSEAMEEGEPYDMEARLATDGAGQRWIRAIGRPVWEGDEIVALRGSIQEITDHKRREAELARTRDLLQQAQHMGGVGGWELDISERPYEGIWTEQLFEILGIESREPFTLQELFEYVHPDDRDWVTAEITRGIESREPFSLEHRILTAGGDERWVSVVAEPVNAGEDVYRGAIIDVTAQKEREVMLEALHETARGLLQTQTAADVAELAMETAEDVLAAPCSAVYLLDDDSGQLEPVAFTDDFEEQCGGPNASSSTEGSSLLWQAYVSESATTLSESSIGEAGIFEHPITEAVYVPIGDHGVFVVASPAGTITPETRRVAETLVATMEAALHRLDSENDLREREAELEARNRRLRRQVQINEIIRKVDQSLIGASSREEIETAVCERLTESEDLAFAWIGTLDATEGGVVPRAWAGTSHDYLDSISLAARREDTDPAVRTATTGDATVVGSVVQAVKSEDWRKHALVSNFSSAVAVPIELDEYTYGVLGVYGTEPEQFGDLERDVFEELGESIANSINAVETRQALYADVFVELTIRLDDSEDFLARVARETDADVEYVGLGTHSEDESRVFFQVTGAEPEAVDAMLEDTVSVGEHRRIGESGDAHLFEATVAGEVLAADLVRRGGVPRSMTATDGQLEATVDVPASINVREFVETLREQHPSAELVSRRDVERDVETRQELVSSLFEALTDRQIEVLRTAYFAGFFSWPRESTGEDIAELLDVSQPTVNRHVRHGLQRLLEQLFEEEPATIAGAH